MISYTVGGVTNFVSSIYTDFDFTMNEGQAAGGDSGGAVFTYSSSQWWLSGVLVTVGNYSGQPTSTSVFGDATYSVNLATYLDQIPEPGTLSMFLFFSAWMAAGRRRTSDRE